MSHGSYCIVKDCNNNKMEHDQYAFFTLPKNAEVAKEWIMFSGRNDLLVADLYLKKNYRVCSAHFLPEHFKTTYPRKLLKPNSVPCVNRPSEAASLSGRENGPQDIIDKMVEEESPIEPTTPKRPRTEYDEISCARYTKTPKRPPSQLTPRTSRKLKRMSRNINSLRCKLFRKQKIPQCVCNGERTYSHSRVTIFKLIKESKPYLSKDAHTLFSNELRSAFVSKYRRRYDDRMKELCLLWYYASPKGYKTLLNALHLPSPRSLRKWQSQFKIEPGINRAVVESIKMHFLNASDDAEKICSAVFDEMSLNEELHYDISKDKVVGVIDTGKVRKNEKAKSALVCMVRGTTSNWKHILGYWFVGGTATSEFIHSIYMDCFDAAAEAGLLIKSVICDQSPVNQKVAKELNITSENNFFFHKNQKIYFIYDVPHLLKSLRNNLSKYDLLYKERIVSWKHIVKASTTENALRVRLLPKITSEHLNVTSFNAMRVKYASQVFSDSMSVALLVFQNLGELNVDAQVTSEFISDVDKLFDCLNSCKLGIDKIKLRYAITADSPHQDFLIKMRENLKNAKFIGAQRTKPPCLTGWLISINSVLQLSKDLRDNYNVGKLLTRQLNQDPVENFFATVRQQHGCCRNPNPLQFENGLRHNYITAIAKLSTKTNCENDYTFILTKLSKLSTMEVVQKNEPENQILDPKNILELTDNVTLTEENAIYYVSGFVIKKFLKVHNCDECRTLLVDKDKLLSGEHKLFTFYKQSENIDYDKGLIFASDTAYSFFKKVEVIHNEYFPKLMKCEAISKAIKVIRETYDLNLSLCSVESSELFLSLYIKMRCHWAVRLENRNKAKKVSTKNQKLKNILHE